MNPRYLARTLKSPAAAVAALQVCVKPHSRSELHRLRRFLHPFRVSFCSAMLLTACRRQDPAAIAPSSGPAVSVQVQVMKMEPQQTTEEVVGTVRSRLRAAVEAKASGRILRYLVVPGQLVKAGELLAELDAGELQARQDQASAMVEQADRELLRYKQLLPTDAISRQEFNAVEARQKVAAASLREAGTMLGYARITAPFDGVISRKLAEVGDLALPGKPLMEIESPSDLRFEADLPEGLLPWASPGAGMLVWVAAVAQPLEVTVSEVAPVADPASRTFQVKFDLPKAAGLRAGQFGRVAVPLAVSQVLRVPAASIMKRGQMELVYVVREAHATLRLVKTGKTLKDGIEILSGLEPDEQVITEGVEKISEGQPVKVQS